MRSDVTCDVKFSQLVHATAALHEQSALELAEYLRSDAPLGPGERDMLADFIAGEFALSSRRGAQAKVSPSGQRAAVAEFVQRTDNGEPAEAVANEIYNQLDVRRSTFFQWISEIRPIILKLDSMGLDGVEIMKSR